MVITLTTVLLEIVDQLCIGLIQAAGETTESMGNQLLLLANALAGLNIAAPGVGAIVSIFLAGLMIAAIGIVWFSLLIRKALILVTVVLAPLALSGASWEVTKGWIGKWATFLIALIVSKLVRVVVFLVAITQVATPIDSGLTAVTEPIAGIVLLGIAAFAPYMVYRLISFIGFDLYNSMGAEQDAKSAMNRPLPIPSKPNTDGTQKILDGAGGDGDSGGGGVDAAEYHAARGNRDCRCRSGNGSRRQFGACCPGRGRCGRRQRSRRSRPGSGERDRAAGRCRRQRRTEHRQHWTPATADGNRPGDVGSTGAPPPPSPPVPNTPPDPNPAPPTGGKE